MSFPRAILISAALLVAMLTLSVAIGPVWIPPGTVLSLLAGRLGGDAPAQAAAIFSTILFEIRLPHALLIVLARRPARAVRDPRCGLRRCGRDGTAGLQPGALWQEPADNDAHPGRRGDQLVRHLTDILPDAALQRRA